MDAVRTALDAQDWATAERLAHTTKAVAANIGAMPLQAVASTLEAGIKDRTSLHELQVHVGTMGEMLAAVIAQLEEHLPGEPVRVGSVVDLEKLRQVSQHLADLLANYNSAAIDVMDAHGDLLRPAWRDDYAKIESAVRDFDFEQALTALKVAMQTYEKPPTDMATHGHT
jgi:two-component system sensor histidine kinase/response regulator